MRKVALFSLGVASAVMASTAQAQINVSNGSWEVFTGASQAGTPFWANESDDNLGTGRCNIGYFLTTVLGAGECNNPKPGNARLQSGDKGIGYMLIGNNAAGNNATFSFTGGLSYQVTYLGRFAGLDVQTFSVGDQTFLGDAAPVTKTVTSAENWWFTGNTAAPVGTASSNQLYGGGSNWAAFLTQDQRSLYVAFEDKWTNPAGSVTGFDYDYNDGIFKVEIVGDFFQVPEPASFALLIPVAIGLAAVRRRRNTV